MSGPRYQSTNGKFKCNALFRWSYHVTKFMKIQCRHPFWLQLPLRRVFRRRDCNARIVRGKRLYTTFRRRIYLPPSSGEVKFQSGDLQRKRGILFLI